MATSGVVEYEKVPPEATQRLQDEKEELYHVRCENYERLKGKLFGLQTFQTGSFQNDYKTLLSNKFDFFFRNLIPRTAFENVLNDPLCWGDDQSWKKALLKFSRPGGHVEELKIISSNGKNVATDSFLGGVLSCVETRIYQSDMLVQRISKLLQAEVKFFLKQGIFALLYEIMEIPSRCDRMEYILCILLEEVRKLQLRETRDYILILKFHVRNDVQSRECLSWYKRFRKSVIGWPNLRPAVRFFNDMLSEHEINRWLEVYPACVFISKSLFRYNAKCAPLLMKPHRRVLLKFLEVRSQLVVQDYDDYEEPNVPIRWYGEYLKLIWHENLLPCVTDSAGLRHSN